MEMAVAKVKETEGGYCQKFGFNRDIWPSLDLRQRGGKCQSGGSGGNSRSGRAVEWWSGVDGMVS